MTAIEIETTARQIADMAERIGGRFKLDYWKVRNLVGEKETFRIMSNLRGIVDFVSPDNYYD